MSQEQLTLKIEGESVQFEDGGTLYDIHPCDDYWHRCNERCQAAWPIEKVCAERVVACWNACRGLPMINGTITVVADMKAAIFSGDEEMTARIREYLSSLAERTEP